MRRLFVFVAIIVFSGLLSAQNRCEYLIMRAIHYTKKHGIDTRLYVDISQEFNHSLKGIIENGPLNSVRFNQPDGTVISVKNETDFMNTIGLYGFRLFESYPVTITGKVYIQYIFVKEE